jgi:hypothetical protein
MRNDSGSLLLGLPATETVNFTGGVAHTVVVNLRPTPPKPVDKDVRFEINSPKITEDKEPE